MVETSSISSYTSEARSPLSRPKGAFTGHLDYLQLPTQYNGQNGGGSSSNGHVNGEGSSSRSFRSHSQASFVDESRAGDNYEAEDEEERVGWRSELHRVGELNTVAL